MLKIKKITKFLSLLILATFLLVACTPPQTEDTGQGSGYSNKKIQWGLKRNKGDFPEVPQEWETLLKKYDGYFLGDRASKKIYLTFDEGYENGYTPQILDVLSEYQVPAAFFITGPYLKQQQNLVERMVKEGHIVGNHTINHPSMPDISDEKVVSELKDLNSDFFDLTGQNMKYLRPPRGEFSERTLALSQKNGYKTILWSNAYADWDMNKANTVQNAHNQVTNFLHNGCIILLHAVSKENAQALPEIIKTARSMGYTFASLDEL